MLSYGMPMVFECLTASVLGDIMARELLSLNFCLDFGVEIPSPVGLDSVSDFGVGSENPLQCCYFLL